MPAAVSSSRELGRPKGLAISITTLAMDSRTNILGHRHFYLETQRHRTIRAHIEECEERKSW